MLCRAITVNKIFNIPDFLEIAYWTEGKIKIMQLDKCVHRESPGNGAMKKIREIL